METILVFISNLIQFIFAPFAGFKVLFILIKREGLFFLRAPENKNLMRELDRSVTDILAAWYMSVIIILFGYILFEKTNGFLNRLIIGISISLFVLSVQLFVSRSYEIWNWLTMLNVIEILSKKCKEEAVPEEVKKFLKRRIRYTYNYYTRAKFEHLENIFRKVGLWKGQRRELIE